MQINTLEYTLPFAQAAAPLTGRRRAPADVVTRACPTGKRCPLGRGHTNIYRGDNQAGGRVLFGVCASVEIPVQPAGLGWPLPRVLRVAGLAIAGRILGL